MIRVNRTQIIQLLNDHHDRGNGSFFWVSFVKRSTGEIRSINARFDVRKYLKGGPAAYDPKEKQLFHVFDIQAEISDNKTGYRSIPYEGILEAKIAHEHYIVED